MMPNRGPTGNRHAADGAAGSAGRQDGVVLDHPLAVDLLQLQPQVLDAGLPSLGVTMQPDPSGASCSPLFTDSTTYAR
jgi:hypothetical protein